MIKSKFITSLSTLNSKEFAEFSRFLSKSYSAQDAPMLVFNYIKSFRPQYADKKKLNSKAACEKIFNKRQSSDAADPEVKLGNALSDLFLKLKEFLVNKKTEADSFEKGFIWLDILLTRDLDHMAQYQLDKLKASTTNSKEIAVESYLYKTITSYLDCYKFPKKTSEKTYLSLQNALYDLDAFYLLVRLKLACEMKNREKLALLQKAAEDDFDPAVWQHRLSDDFLAAHPLIHAYYEVWQLLSAQAGPEATRHFQQTFTLAKDNCETIIKEEQAALLVYLRNYAINRVRYEEEAFYEYGHAINVFIDDHGIYEVKGVMSPSMYLNAVAFACQVGQFDWVETFIEKYFSKISAQKNSTHYKWLAQGLLDFKRGRPQKALETLQKGSIKDFLYFVRSTPLLMACHYELDHEEESILQICKAFEKRLSRQKVAKGDVVRAMLNFSQILRKIAGKTTGRKAITKEIKATMPLYLKDWLLQKADAYKFRS